MKIQSSGPSFQEMDMTPMIDMTFQLIAFFMFTINFNTDLTNELVVLPVAERAVPVERALESPLFLNVDRTGVLHLPGASHAISKPEGYSKIKAYLEREAKAERNQRRRTKVPAQAPLRTTIVIRAHEATECGPVQELLRACREAGFVKFSLRANVAEENRKP